MYRARFFYKFGVFRRFSLKSPICNFTAIRPVRAALVHADRWTYMTTLFPTMRNCLKWNGCAGPSYCWFLYVSLSLSLSVCVTRIHSYLQNINLLNCTLHSKIVETKWCGNVHDAFTYRDGPLQRQCISTRFHSVISKSTAIFKIFHTRVYMLIAYGCVNTWRVPPAQFFKKRTIKST
jgi:hypothetical protein